MNLQSAGVQGPVAGRANILAISGSLRAASPHTSVLRAMAHLAPPNVVVDVLSGLEELEHFNPDMDAQEMALPQRVLDLRRRVGAADALMLCSPEYAHGVPGTLKNALDWLMSAPEAFGKPVALLNTSPRSWHAQAALAETLRRMWMQLVPAASITVPVMGRNVDAQAIARDPTLNAALRGALDALLHVAQTRTRLPYRDARSPIWGSATMLQFRPNCECCGVDLPPHSPVAVICSFQCTFCRDCAQTRLEGRCPTCGGELLARPRPPKDTLRVFSTNARAP